MARSTTRSVKWTSPSGATPFRRRFADSAGAHGAGGGASGAVSSIRILLTTESLPVHHPLQARYRRRLQLPDRRPCGDVQGLAIVATERAVGDALRARDRDQPD